MRVLFLTYNVVGQSNYLRAEALARKLAAGGQEITLMSAPGHASGSSHSETIPVGEGRLTLVTVRARGSTRLRNSGLSLPEVVRRRSALCGRAFALVHGFGHRPSVNWVGPALADRLRVPYVADWCDLFGDGGIRQERGLVERWTLGALDGWFERRNIRRADGISVISSALSDRANRINPIALQVRVPPGGLPEASIGARAEVRRELDLPPDARVVVHISQNHQDLDLLRRTVSCLLTRRQDVHCLLVGPTFPSLDWSETAAARLHLTGSVAHHRIPAFLAAADTAVLPYPASLKNEHRFPCSFAEYAGAGLPVVTQATGDLGRGEHLGALVVPAEPEAMTAGIGRVLDEAGLAQRLSREARLRAANELSWSVGARRLLDLYGRLVEKPATARTLAAL